MDARKPLYGVTVSSSGLIFAMIVGAWAAYLVPMWLRKQDELNEARPTERFSTAIRLLTRGRRASAEAAEDSGEETQDLPDPSADVRSFAEPVSMVKRVDPTPPAAPTPAPAAAPAAGQVSPAPSAAAPTAAATARAKVLARRRRTTIVLLLAFTLGGIFALTSGGYLWLPAIPAVLLAAYVVHVRRQERRRYEVAVDRRRAEEAARRLRQRTRPGAAAAPEKPSTAVVEQTDHAEWVDQQRRRIPAPEDEPQSWEPAPVPLPTYVNAPVAPRTTRGVDLDAPDTWSAARSTTAGTGTPKTPKAPAPGPQRTPLFDQYADEDRRRAAGE
ncbi:hypothetical protein [Streptomyces hoynatensis]|uniref:Uncharacterized protein n=1 Tax=Streptomyces hoynatensis TaxID=1141874 RepID=A0A3A9Z000_9ACTN|nr:hypothetical protein [Streptomyces hoynatensis]RKN41623.1 hypothetical protein D7294_14085 [Streptomyces hoynatensis]